MSCLNPLQEVTIGPIINVAMAAAKKRDIMTTSQWYKKSLSREIRENAKLKQTQQVIILHYFIVEWKLTISRVINTQDAI